MKRPCLCIGKTYFSFLVLRPMQEHFLPSIDKENLRRVMGSGNDNDLMELLVTPLHEELYRRQDFNFLDVLSTGQQLILSYDYLQQQVDQGGFIQFLVNGYAGLLPEMPGWLLEVGATEMAAVIDGVLKIYVLNIAIFRTEMTTREFAKLYEELKEFEVSEQRFHALRKSTLSAMMSYAKEHMEDFVQ